MNDQSNPLPPENSIGFLLNRTARTLGQTLRNAFLENGYDITPEQWGLLSHLCQEDGQHQQQLACAQFKDKASIARLIDGLEKRALIERKTDPQDRRSNFIFLTPEGRKLRQKLLPIARVVYEKSATGMSSGELDTLVNSLNRIYRNLASAE